MNSQLSFSVVATIFGAATIIATPSAFGESNTVRNDEVAPTSVTLLGDSEPTSITRLWEYDLKNNDQYEDFTSMVQTDDDLFLCVNPYCVDSSNHAKNIDHLTIRRYSKLTGAETIYTITNLPEEVQVSSPQLDYGTITVDDNGNLIYIQPYPRRKYGSPGYKYLDVRLYRINLDKSEFDTSRYVSIRCDLLNSNEDDNYAIDVSDVKTHIHIDQVPKIQGDFVSGDFTFEARMGLITLLHPNTTRYFFCSFDAATQTATKSDPYDVNIENITKPRVKRIDIAEHPANSNILILSPFTFEHETINVSSYPMLFNRETGGYEWDWTSTDAMLLDNDFSGKRDKEFCRGVYPFMHNGHTLICYADHCNAQDGVQFQLAAWPDATSFANLTDVALLPSTPYEFPSDIYYGSFRQYVLTENVESDEASITNFYLYVPGSGIGAYQMVTRSPSIYTGIDNTDDATAPTLTLDGRTLTVATSAGTLRIYTATGALALSTAIEAAGATIDLSALPAGVYFAATATTTTRLLLR
jgi:hypothetical protein